MSITTELVVQTYGEAGFMKVPVYRCEHCNRPFSREYYVKDIHEPRHVIQEVMAALEWDFLHVNIELCLESIFINNQRTK